jgi:ankyrin repeat protein
MGAVPLADALCRMDEMAVRNCIANSPPSPDFEIDGQPVMAWLAGHISTLSVEQRPSALRIVDLLIRSGVNLDKIVQKASPITALITAAIHGDTHLMRRLLAGGADVRIKTALANTALHWASASSHPAAVRLLAEHGADLDAQNDAGETPLHWAAKRMNRPMMRELYKLGASWKVKDKKGETPIERISHTDPRLALWWEHKPAKDALENGTPRPPRPTSPRSSRL